MRRAYARLLAAVERGKQRVAVERALDFARRAILTCIPALLQDMREDIDRAYAQEFYEEGTPWPSRSTTR